MTELLIQGSSHDYEVVIDSGVRHQLSPYLSDKHQSILVISDERVAGYYLEDVVRGLGEGRKVFTALVPAGEASKSMEHYQKLLDACIDAQLDRASLIIALGGGMIGDLAGFVASTYLRGIDFIQLPTTILAHDSSVGGKVAINHPQGKNMIGCFYNPVKVIYDIETLATLSNAEIRSGYGEIIKHALLSSENWTHEVLKSDLSLKSSDQLAVDLKKGIQVKASIVEKDERENNLRRHLNLGHTLAHAIEAELGYGKMTHGEAVAIGTLFALQLSEKLRGSNLPIKNYVNWLLSNQYPIHNVKDINPNRLIERMKWDKKAVHQSIHYVLLDSIGAPYVEPVSDEVLLKELNRFFSEVIHR